MTDLKNTARQATLHRQREREIVSLKLISWCRRAASICGLSRWMRPGRTPLRPRQPAGELARSRSLAGLICVIVAVGGFSLFRHAGPGAPFAIVLYLIVSIVAMVLSRANYRDLARLIAAQSRTQAQSNENRRLAYLDPLTNLPNRRYFFRRLSEEFERAARNSECLAVGLLDLDGFKPVNDLHGHPVGDELLCQVGERISRIWSCRGHLARIGGDEFAFIIARPEKEELLALGKKTCAALRAPFVLSCATVRISASIGFATFPEMSDDAKTLYERADYALYRTKRVDRGRATLYAGDQERGMRRDTRIEQCLYGANREQTGLALQFINVDFQRGRKRKYHG